MHIQERNNTTLTTCTKMTEEVDRRHGMNGNSSSKGVSDENSVQSSALPNSTSPGGRLKFFKDGKFILELARARSGERVGWVSVPRKTFWPPPPSAPAAPVAPLVTPRQERATSLSVSDDNSSVQSSPWQRDHCWKQLAPRRGASRELGLLYVRPSRLPTALLATPAARRKRRRPLCTQPVSLPTTNGMPRLPNGCSSPDAPDTVDSPGEASRHRSTDKPTGIGKFKFLKKADTAESLPLRVYSKLRRPVERRELSKVIEMLKEKLPMQFTPVNAKITALNCKQEHMMVSPRKRILRELERVSLEDLASKRSRARQAPPTPQPGPSSAPDAPPKLYNGTTHTPPRRDPPVSKPVSSYSIHSILSMPEESSSRSPDLHPVKKPHAYKTETLSPAPSPSPEHFRRQAAWARSPPGPAYPPPLPYGPPGPSRPPDKPKPYEGYREEPPVPYQMYPSYLPGAYLSGYPAYGPRPPPLWLPYPALPPGPWAPLPHPLLTDRAPSQDASSDLPLNLSKH